MEGLALFHTLTGVGEWLTKTWLIYLITILNFYFTDLMKVLYKANSLAFDPGVERDILV